MIIEIDGRVLTSGEEYEQIIANCHRMADIAGAIEPVAWCQQCANNDLTLLFEHERYRQIVGIRDIGLMPYGTSHQEIIDTIIRGLQHMNWHAIHLIYLYQVPEGFDVWQNEGGK